MLPEVKVWTIKQVAHYLGVHPSTLYRMLRRHEITAYKIGSDWRFNMEDVDKWRREHALAQTDSSHHPGKKRSPKD